jgi:hypothetical protein
MRKLELQTYTPDPDYERHHQELRPDMRAQLIDWLMEVNNEQRKPAYPQSSKSDLAPASSSHPSRASLRILPGGLCLTSVM